MKKKNKQRNNCDLSVTWADMPSFMKKDSSLWAAMSQQLQEHEMQQLKQISSKEYALRKSKKIDAEDYYSAKIPLRKSEDNEFLLYAIEQRDAYLELVRKGLNKKKTSVELMFLWGRLNFYAGAVELASRAKKDDLSPNRNAKGRAKIAQRQWLAHMIINKCESIGKSREVAQKSIVKFIRNIANGKLKCPDPRFDAEWFSNLLSEKEEDLVSQYRPNDFTLKVMRNLIREPLISLNNIPPTSEEAYLSK